ncbi:hypothetical protein D6821_00765 [Candidatus Parcubacteria bacterium]|nr:MAG: hypothetical protein D6821_00765 [Candidatus Parcubacteria bacterium]
MKNQELKPQTGQSYVGKQFELITQSHLPDILEADTNALEQEVERIKAQINEAYLAKRQKQQSC